VRHTGVDEGLEKIEAKGVGLVYFLLGTATGANEPPARELIALLYESEVFGAALTARNLLDGTTPIHGVAIG
jgi:hypothetical protein